MNKFYQHCCVLSDTAENSGEEDHLPTLTSTPILTSTPTTPTLTSTPTLTPTPSTSQPGKRIKRRLPIDIPGAAARKKRKRDTTVQDGEGELERYQAWSEAALQRQVERDDAIR